MDPVSLGMWGGGALGLLALGLSARYTWWRRNRRGVPVLMYHHVTDKLNGTGLPKLRVSPKAFARQLDYLWEKGYRTVTMSQAAKGELPEKAVVLTFDDGFLNFYYEAWPLLRERRMTATVFVVTGCLDGINAWDLDKGEPKEAILSRAHVRDLSSHGIEFGGHGHAHKNLTRLDGRQLLREVTGCQKVLSDLLGFTARSFAYPYGKWNLAAAQAVERAGFDAACTIHPGKLESVTPAYAIPRIIVKRSDNLLDFGIKLKKAKSRL